MREVEEKTILQFINENEKDSNWVAEHYDELRATYEGKVVAVKNKKIIGADEDINKLIKNLKRIGIDPSSVLLETFAPEDVSFIL